MVVVLGKRNTQVLSISGSQVLLLQEPDFQKPLTSITNDMGCFSYFLKVHIPNDVKF